MKTDYFDKAAQQFSKFDDREDPAGRGQLAKAWITIAANTRNFFPQNLTGRRYTGGNAFFTPFPLREIPVPDTRIYDIQPGERGRDLRAERIEIVSGLLLPFLRVPQGNTQENNL